MKRLIFTVLFLFAFVSVVSAQTLQWDDVSNEDGYIIKYKAYPAGYSYPANLAPATDIQDMTGAAVVNLAADVVEWDLPSASFTAGSRYVFVIQATLSGSVSGYSDFLCWTWPLPSEVIEKEVQSGAGIQINIYQKP